MSKVLSVYAAGGAAVNIVSRFNSTRQGDSTGFAKLQPYFIDTSRSNIDAKTPDEDVYLFDGLDGSGKDRSSNYAVIAERAKEILHKFRPSDFNLVLHSTSGGSGSTIGPVIVSELLSRGENVIVLLVGSTGSKKETENTLRTLQSYEVISKKREKPVVAFYRENSAENPRGTVDQRVYFTLALLAAFFSGENRELDTADLRNFLTYPKVTSFPSGFVGLDLFTKDITLAGGETLYSLATLVDDKTSPDASVPFEYQAVGFLPSQVNDALSVELPLHAAVLGGYFHGVVKRLQDRLVSFDDHRKAAVVKPLDTSHIQPTDDGLVL